MTYFYEYFGRIIKSYSFPLTYAYFFFSLMFAISGTLAAQTFTVDTDRANANYQLGEMVTFQIHSTVTGTANYEILLDKHSSALEKGSVSLQAGQVTELSFVTTTPAVVLCKVKKDGITQLAAAAISSFDLAPVEEEPEDFDEFWEEAHLALANIPIDPKISLYRESEYATTYRVNIASIDNRRVYGYISVPKMDGPFPAVLTLPAYGRVANVVTPAIYLAEQAGVLSFAISIHNAEPDTVDPNAYAPNNIMDESSNYYRYALLACVRAIDYLSSRSDFNGDLAVTGVSQGGGLALMTAGLDERVDLLIYSNASHCEHTGKKYDTASGFPYYLNQASLMYNIDESEEEAIVQACKYYDAIYFARRYEGPSLGFISYQDEVSPPTTTFKAFNALNGKKILMHGKDLKHEHPQEYWVGRYDALRRFMPGTQRAPWPYARKTQGYFLDIGADQIVEQGNSIAFSPELQLHEETLNLPATWHQLAGPAAVSFSEPNSLATTATFSEPGTYKLQVRVWDETLLASKSKFYSISDEVTVRVHDGNAPLLVECAKDITLFTNTNTASATWALPTIQSSCNDEYPTIMQTAGLGMGSAFPIGRTRISYRIEDACGNQTTCDFYVTVLKEGFSPLEVDCPENISIYTDNQYGIGMWELPTVISACNESPATYTQTEGLALGSSFPIGDTPIHYQITDACGQTANCSFTVTVIQNVNPLLIDCPADIVVYTDSTSLPIHWELPSILSACRDSTVEYVQLEGLAQNALFPLGETQISYEVRDACGQVASCSFTISLIQNIAPFIIQCPSDTTITSHNGSSIPTWELPTIVSACQTDSIQYTQTEGPLIGSPFPIGDTQITYELTDACGQEASCSFVINVVQVEQAPLHIECPSAITLYTTTGSALPEWELPEVYSSCGEGLQFRQIEGLPLGSTFRVGTSLVSYEVMDGCGQMDTCSFLIEVIDENPPNLAIACPFNVQLNINAPDTVLTWELPSVLSACNEETVQYTQVVGPAPESVFSTGFTRITYKVEDACGQVKYCSFNITIFQNMNSPLEVDCPNNIKMMLPFGAMSSQVDWAVPQASSTCSDELIVSQIQGPDSGSFFQEGTSTVAYLIQDGCGNRELCTFDIHVVARSEYDPDMLTFAHENSIECYPNPTSNLLYIQWQSEQVANVHLEVINLLGQVLYHSQIQSEAGRNTQQLALSDLAAGCYILQLRSDENWVNRKQFVKQ